MHPKPGRLRFPPYSKERRESFDGGCKTAFRQHASQTRTPAIPPYSKERRESFGGGCKTAFRQHASQTRTPTIHPLFQGREGNRLAAAARPRSASMHRKPWTPPIRSPPPKREEPFGGGCKTALRQQASQTLDACDSLPYPKERREPFGGGCKTAFRQQASQKPEMPVIRSPRPPGEGLGVRGFQRVNSATRSLATR